MNEILLYLHVFPAASCLYRVEHLPRHHSNASSLYNIHTRWNSYIPINSIERQRNKKLHGKKNIVTQNVCKTMSVAVVCFSLSLFLSHTLIATPHTLWLPPVCLCSSCIYSRWVCILCLVTCLQFVCVCSVSFVVPKLEDAQRRQTTCEIREIVIGGTRSSHIALPPSST